MKQFSTDGTLPTSGSIEHIENLDMLRVVSCVAVVMLHVSARTIYLYDEVTPTIWNIANVISSSTRWCVPEFVMISGALLLRGATDDPMRFIKRRFAKIVVPIIFWSGVYLLWRAWNQPITLPYAAGELFRGTPNAGGAAPWLFWC